MSSIFVGIDVQVQRGCCFAVVDENGLQKEVRLDVVDRWPEVGDYIIVHAGFAIHTLDPAEAAVPTDLSWASESSTKHAARDPTLTAIGASVCISTSAPPINGPRIDADDHMLL